MSDVQARCPECNSTYFAARKLTYPIPNIKEVYLVYCSKCGRVVGVASSK